MYLYLYIVDTFHQAPNQYTYSKKAINIIEEVKFGTVRFFRIGRITYNLKGVYKLYLISWQLIFYNAERTFVIYFLSSNVLSALYKILIAMKLNIIYKHLLSYTANPKKTDCTYINT
jgi:hypothetical protein